MSTHGHDAVRTICERWATMSVEELREVMAEDCDYRNVPIDGDRHIGPDAAHAVLSTVRGSGTSTSPSSTSSATTAW